MATSSHLELPPGVEIISGPKGPMFRGSAEALNPTVIDGLRRFAAMPTGSRLAVGKFVFCSSEEIALPPDSTTVVLPPHAWGIVASKFAEVTTGWEESPFYFSECGYLWPPPDPDLGVELLGMPLKS